MTEARELLMRNPVRFALLVALAVFYGIHFPRLLKTVAPVLRKQVHQNNTEQLYTEYPLYKEYPLTSTNWNDSEVFPIPNVLLLGQFNYNPKSVKSVQDWVSIWSRYFSNIMVVGPFSSDIGSGLNQAGIAFRLGPGDGGVVSPYANLAKVASEIRGNSTIEAVLYLHDDLMLNLTYFLSRNDGIFPTDRFLWNYDDEVERKAYSINIVHEIWQNGTLRNFVRENGTEFTGRVFKVREIIRSKLQKGTKAHEYPWQGNVLPYQAQFSSIDGEFVANTPAEFVSKNEIRPPWLWDEWCIMQQLSMLVQGPRSVLDDYAIEVEESERSSTTFNTTIPFTRVSRKIRFYSQMQSDFFLLPTKWADDFSRLAEVFADHDIFLESAFPTITRWLLDRNQKMIRQKEIGYENAMLAQNIPLCTVWNWRLRGRESMLDLCLEKDEADYGAIHPLKLGLMGSHKWATCLNRTQLSPSAARANETTSKGTISA